jgi:hypothetical protein
VQTGGGGMTGQSSFLTQLLFASLTKPLEHTHFGTQTAKQVLNASEPSQSASHPSEPQSDHSSLGLSQV